jgi:hypothetical protein
MYVFFKSKQQQIIQVKIKLPSVSFPISKATGSGKRLGNPLLWLLSIFPEINNTYTIELVKWFISKYIGR